jgi:hypothetical protein
MSDPETTLLARARRGLAPTEADARRVRSAVDLALGASPATAGPSSKPGVPAGPVPVHWTRLGAALALAAATGVGGYALGLRAGRNEIPPLTRAPVIAPPTPSAPERLDARDAPTPIAPTSAPAATTRLPRVRSDIVEAPHVVETPHVVEAPSAAASTDGESSLELETRLLERVERSLRADNPRLALGVLGELDREVPGGQLEEERRAARVIAHCKLGTASAPKLASEFETRYASSAYRDRIRAACAGAYTPSE